MTGSAPMSKVRMELCPVCGRRVRVTKWETLARHNDEYGHRCDNTGRRTT